MKPLLLCCLFCSTFGAELIDLVDYNFTFAFDPVLENHPEIPVCIETDHYTYCFSIGSFSFNDHMLNDENFWINPILLYLSDKQIEELVNYIYESYTLDDEYGLIPLED